MLAGCSATGAIYGIPEQQWNRMSETEQQATIKSFKQQELVNAKTRRQAEKAKKAAEKSARQCHETEEEPYESKKWKDATRHQWLF